MGELKDRLDQSDRKLIVADTKRLIDDEVSRKSGLSGMALKGGYKVVRKLRGGRMIEDAVDGLLDEFTAALDPLYDDYLDQDVYDSFEAYLVAHDDQATNALLGITDAKATRADNKVVKKTYQKLRGQAEGHVSEALAGVGRLIDKHAPKKKG